MPPSLHRTRLAVAALVGPATAGILACAGGAIPLSPDATRHGVVRGTVTDLAGASPGVGGAGSAVYLLRDPDAPRGAAVRTAAISGAAGAFAFVVDSVPPGRYYLEACLTVPRGRACAPSAHAIGGPPAAIDVVAGGRAEIAVLF